MSMNIEHFKERLGEEKARLESEMEGVGRRNPRVPDDWEIAPSENGVQADPVDQADTIAARESAIALLGDLEARYDTIIAALKKIEDKTYGVCDVCGEPISEARLEANPAAATCAKHLS